jgi:hypothetical protein
VVVVVGMRRRRLRGTGEVVRKEKARTRGRKTRRGIMARMRVTRSETTEKGEEEEEGERRSRARGIGGWIGTDPINFFSSAVGV